MTTLLLHLHLDVECTLILEYRYSGMELEVFWTETIASRRAAAKSIGRPLCLGYRMNKASEHTT